MRITKDVLLFTENFAKRYNKFSLIDYISYFEDLNINNLDNNLISLDDISQNDWVLLFHATDLEYANSIMNDGFGDGKANWKESIKKYTYLGERTGLEAYLEPHDNPVIMFVIVRKKNILPDGEDDWMKYIKNETGKKIIKNYGINSKNPTSVDTLIVMNQVKAENHHVTPLGLYNPKNNQFYVRPCDAK